MKLPCCIVEDLLPLHHDGVCTPETVVLVEEHLAGCADCRNRLRDLQNEVDLPAAETDDLKPLETIRREWNRTKKNALKKGLCIALAAVLLVFGVISGVWYFGCGRTYDVLARELDEYVEYYTVSGEPGYMKTTRDYRFAMRKPGFLKNNGQIMVDALQVNGADGLQAHLRLTPQFGGGYEFAVALDSEAGGFWLYLNRDLSLVEDAYSEQGLARMEQLLEVHREEIEGLFDAVYELWGLQLLEVS